MRVGSSIGGLCRIGLVAIAALCVAGVTAAAAQTTVPLATVSGGVAVHYNNNGGGENVLNQAYLRGQFSETNTNGGLLNFDTTPLPGGGGVSWYDIFQAVPDQFGLDLIVESNTSDGTTPTPVLDAFDNVDNSLAGAANAGPVTWAINGYTGPTNGPANPANGIINSVLRGGTGGPGNTLDGLDPASTLDGSLTNLTVSLSQVGTVFTITMSGELNTDGLVHWYGTGLGTSPISNLALTGKLFFNGTYTYDSSTDTNPLMDFYAGTTAISAEVICGDRFVDTATGNDTGNLCTDSLNPCATIQYGVNVACPGDTVNVAAGVYDEQVEIGRSVTVVGAGTGSTIVQPSAVAGNTTSLTTGASMAAIILVEDATDVTVRDLTVDGAAAAFGACSPGYVGMFYRNAAGTIDATEVTNVFQPSAPGCQGVLGILVQSGGAGTSIVSISGSSVDNYGKNGITCNEVGTECTITGNTVVGRGPVVSGDAAQNGIQIGDGAVGSIVGNAVSDNYYSPMSWCSAGILVTPGPGGASDGVEVRGNTLSDSLCDLFAMTNGSTITGNEIPAAREFPFSVMGDGNIVDGNYVNGSPYDGVYVDGINNSFTCNRITNNGTTGVCAASLCTAGDVGAPCSVDADCDLGAAFTFDSTSGYGSGPGTPNAVNTNAISGNAIGVDGSLVVSPPDIDATGNWWGCAAGPGGSGCDTVTANVDASSPAASEPLCVTCAGAGGDTDGDGVCDPVDNCVLDANPTQDDTDGDLVGDACDPCPLDNPDDTDGDTICDTDDACPLDPDNDADGDTVCGDVDNCPATANASQADFDSDGLGDACDDEDVAGFSLRKIKLRADSRPDRGRYSIKGELDATPTPSFASDVAANGLSVIVETSTPPGQVHKFTFAGGDCVEKRGSIKCRDATTRSFLKLGKRTAPAFFKVTASVKRSNFTQPTPAQGPMVVRLQGPVDLLDRRDDINTCSAVSGGKVLRCKDLP